MGDTVKQARDAALRRALDLAPPRSAMPLAFGGSSTPPPPAPPPVVPMPNLNDPAVLAAKTAATQAAAARSGQLSTILSGAGNYTGQKLGAA